MLEVRHFRIWFGGMLLLCASCFCHVARAQENANTEAIAAYRIGAGDVLQIDVWKQPEITRQVPVQTDGTIRMPLLGVVKASGLTATQLAGHLRDELIPFLQNPQVTVTVTRVRGTYMPTLVPARPIAPQNGPQLRDTPPSKCCLS